MAGMQRFVTYIYAYGNGQKMQNTGYAKVETRGEQGRLDIHFVSGSIYRGKGLAAFLYIEKGKLVYVPIGEFQIENGTGAGVIPFQTNILAGTDMAFSKMDGIYIADSEGGRYLSFWNDIGVTDFSEINFVEYSLDMPLPETDESLKREMMEEAEQESLHTMEIPMRNVFPSYAMEDIWKNMARTKMPVQINGEVSAIQMELNDLRELPKRYWYLGNNSFLLHGFFNYHHLLLGRLPDGKWFIGVPGVYARQEGMMAAVFGFPGFMHIGAPEPDAKVPQEKGMPRESQQGIWYHILED